MEGPPTPPPAPDPTTAQDIAHLDLLGVFHYVVAGITALFSMFPVLHLIMGIAMINGTFDAPHRPGDPEAALVGWFFVGIAGLMILCGLAFSALLARAGHCLRQRRNHTYCLVMAAVSCAFFPFGTVLGVFTVIVLSRVSVKPLFTTG